jgi:AcrR family transcriptional regulator
LAETASAIADDGVAKLSMRALAKRVGVSNAAPTYHFADKAGLLTALAAEGFELLAEAMIGTDAVSVEGDGPASVTDGGESADGGLVARSAAYVDFALRCPSHFTVMFQPRLLHDDDADLIAARQRASAALSAGVAAARQGPDSDFVVAAWSLLHGYATLVLSGAVEAEDALSQARSVAAQLVRGTGRDAGA